MPELPEVETVANGVNARIAGDRIEEAWFSSKPEPMKSPPAAMAEALTGRTIERVRRVGKHIVFDFAAQPDRDPVQWIVHLGMTGRLVVADPDVPRPARTMRRMGVPQIRHGWPVRM
ncbi:MAG TPA: DNA-formamidopyrimidine glycosylase family protein [Acidobacteriaceae bacterium]